MEKLLNRGKGYRMELSAEKHLELKRTATQIRKDIVEMTTTAGSGHPGGSLSCADMLAMLYFHRMKIDPDNPNMAGHDRFILSKGHCAPALYSALAEKGFFPREELKKLRQFGSILQGHPSERFTPGIDVASGSLGQGLSVAAGMAMAARLDRTDTRVYAIMGDGEIGEGQVWEAAMSAGHYKLDNLCAIIDNNGLQIDGRIEDVMDSNPIDEKWRSFNWHVVLADGHDMVSLNRAFDEAEATKGKPTMIIAKTIKGKGVSFMENEAGYHGKTATREQADQALAELSAAE
jgi:transketolase